MIDQNTDVIFYSFVEGAYFLYDSEIADNTEPGKYYIQKLSVRDDDTLQGTDNWEYIGVTKILETMYPTNDASEKFFELLRSRPK